MCREVLGEKQMMEYRFLRQRPIGNYIVDFFCKELKLIIEVDGYTHQFEEVAAKDQIREKELENMGYNILRFEDSEVLNDINNVVRTIENWILDREVTP
ncbi:endonuclease domain-containing protein [Ekhidna sp.]|uniref:endonuclease domain-containing protein n=1 Tax=Ekhidna sp. TaxID=2608089 RepID=UPI003C7D93FF